MVGVAILGSTGVIGQATLDVISRHGEALQVVALAAGSNVARLADQARRFRPRLVGVADARQGRALEEAVRGLGCEVVAGGEAALAVACHPEAEVVVAAMVGFAGFRPTLAALELGRRVALANKETLVAGGSAVLEAARRGGGEVVPVDSEHSALFQLLLGRPQAHVARLVLTASGGPFRTWPREAIERATAEDALAHPTWRMGPKITVDSATLMNKGLEVIEAHQLFGVPYDAIEVLVHPQSVVHALVHLADGSTLAHLGPTDMRLPIQYALTHPDRRAGLAPVDLAALGQLTFERPRRDAFPCLRLAEQAGRMGGTMPAVLSAANEVAVAAFLAGRIPFGHIARVIAAVMDRHTPTPNPDVEAILAADAWGRSMAEELVTQLWRDGP